MSKTDVTADGPYEGVFYIPIRYQFAKGVEETVGEYAATVVRAAFREIANHGDFFDVPYHYMQIELADENKTLRLVISSSWNEERRTIDLHIRLADMVMQVITKYGHLLIRSTPDGEEETFSPFPDGKSIQELDDSYYDQ